MIWIIVKREILDNLLSSRFALATILCLVLVVLGAYVSIKDYEKRTKEYSETVLAEKGREVFLYGTPKVYRKPEILGIISRGIERKLGNTASHIDSISFGRTIFKNAIETEMVGTGVGDSAYLKLLEPIDFNFVVRVVISLLAIFLSYDAISGEREAGVLKLMVSNPIPRAYILIAKFLAGIFCLCIPLTMSIIVAILMMQLSDTIQFGTQELVRIGIVFLLSLLYLAGFYLLGLFISCHTKTSTMSLTILLIIWISATVIMPNISTAYVKQFWRITPENEMQEQLARLSSEHGKKFMSAENSDEQNRILKDMALALYRLNEKHRNEINHQVEAAKWLSRLSPSSAFSFAVSAFSRTDIGTYKRLLESTRAYFLHIEMLYDIACKDSKRRLYEIGDKYDYTFKTSESIGGSFRDAIPDIVILLLVATTFFMSAYASFVRYDVR